MQTEPGTSLGGDGYLVLAGLLAVAEVRSLQPLVDRAVAADRGETCARPHNTLVPLRWTDQLVHAVVGDRPRMRRLAGAVGAGDLRWVSGYVSSKHPGSLPLWWHQDWWCWQHPATYRVAAPQVALVCYLTATDPGNGGLRVLPGSHRRSHPVHALLPQAHRESTAPGPEHPALRDQPGQVSLRLRAGDAVVLDYRLLHATHANPTGHRRDALLLNFAPSWGDLPVEIRGHLINHLALPRTDEAPPADHPLAGLLPVHHGQRRDLPLCRDAPSEFAF